MSKFNIEIANKIDDKLVVQIAKYNWLNAFACSINAKTNYLLVKSNNNLVASFAYLVKGSKIITAPFMYYSFLNFYFDLKSKENENVLYQKKIATEIAIFLQKTYKRSSFNLNPEITDVRAFTENGFEAKPLYTYKVDLQNYSFENCFQNTKTKIRKAKKLDLIFEEKIDLDLFKKLHDFTFDRQKKQQGLPSKVFIALLNNLKPNLRQFNAIYNGKTIASHIISGDLTNRFCWGFLASTNEFALKNGVAAWLIDMMFEKIKTDYNYFDFCGANIKSIDAFKAGFGGKLITFYKISHNKNCLKGLIKSLKRCI